MKTITTYYITYLKDGKQVSAWLGINRSPDEFENVISIQERPLVYTETEGKAIKLKDSDEILGNYVWMKDHVLEDYEEVDEPSPDENKMTDKKEEI